MLGENSDNQLQSLSYRAPEILLGLAPYSCKVDVFAAGLVLLELYNGLTSPVISGVDDVDQLRLIHSLKGPIPEALLHSSKQESIVEEARSLAFKPATADVESWVSIQADDLEDKAMALDFRLLIEHMLEIDPASRCSASQALEHDFFKA